MKIENKNQGERGSEREIEIDSRRLQSREKNAFEVSTDRRTHMQ